MNVKLHKFISAAFFGFLFGLYIHYDHVRWNRLGRDAFLAHQSQRFDRFMAQPYPARFSILAAIICFFLFIGAYELVVLGLSKILKTPAKGTQIAP